MTSAFEGTLERHSFFRGRSRLWTALRSIDWLLITAVTLLAVLGLVTMNSFVGENIFFERQVVWVTLGLGLFFFLSFFDYHFLRRTWVIVALFLGTLTLLLLVLVFGDIVRGAQNRFDFGFFAFQPSDPAKLVLIFLLAKYFSRRHVEIAYVKHILVSAAYAFIFIVPVFFEPDLGASIILALIWLGVALVAGISKKHLLAVFLLGAACALLLWVYALEDYQKDRVISFLNPLADLQGTGYNAFQSTIAVGSGGILGKGIGYGTQSKLQFLPEYETDFIFAAFAEEWGFLGVMILFLLFGIVLWRILSNALHAETNFESLFAVGFAIMLMAHIIIHVGMNVGLLPVTGTTLPFMSYGGSHILTEFIGLGILMGMRRYARASHRDDIKRNEFLGI